MMVMWRTCVVWRGVGEKRLKAEREGFLDVAVDALEEGFDADHARLLGTTTIL